MDLSIADLLKTIILGIVEGLTEWLPVSSTGHMILVDEFIKLDVSKAFMDMFLVVIQLGAIMAVVVLSFEKLNPFSSWKTRQEKRDTVQLWMKVIVACIPAAVIGLLFNKYMEEHFMTAPVVATTLIFYGIMFIIVENYNKHRRPAITDLRRLDYKTALIIGIFQVLSLVPGTEPLWRDDPRRPALRRESHGGCGVHVLPGHPGHVRCECAEDGQVRLPLHGCGDPYPGRRHGHGLHCLRPVHQVPHALYQDE